MRLPLPCGELSLAWTMALLPCHASSLNPLASTEQRPWLRCMSGLLPVQLQSLKCSYTALRPSLPVYAGPSFLQRQSAAARLAASRTLQSASGQTLQHRR